MFKCLLGLDNGSSGTYGTLLLDPAGGVISSKFTINPTRKMQDYTKKQQNITRLDYTTFYHMLEEYKKECDRVFVVMERPFTTGDPAKVKTMIQAGRFAEAQLIAIEQLKIGYEVIDSGDWQKPMLPVGVQGSAMLKKASMDVGLRLFPEHEALIKKHKDADGLLIAEWARRKGLC